MILYNKKLLILFISVAFLLTVLQWLDREKSYDIDLLNLKAFCKLQKAFFVYIKK